MVDSGKFSNLRVSNPDKGTALTVVQPDATETVVAVQGGGQLLSLRGSDGTELVKVDQAGTLTAPVVSNAMGPLLDAATANTTYAQLAITTPNLVAPTFVSIGDSITADGGYVQNAASAPVGWFTNVSWHFWGQLLCNSTAIWAGSFGLAGINTQVGLSTYIPYVLALSPKPKYCVVSLGKNNDADTDGLVGFRDSYTSIVSKLRVAGIIPILCTVTPAATPTVNTQIINSHIRNLAFMYRLPLVDNYAAVVDSTTGACRTTFTRDGGTHPSAAGAKAMGAELALALTALEPVNLLATWLPKSSVGYSSVRGTSGTGSQNYPDPLCLLNSNSVQFWVTDNWQMLSGYYSGYNSYSTPGAPIVGRKVTMTNGAGNTGPTAQMSVATALSGDRVLIVGRIQATVESSAGSWFCSIEDSVGNDAFRMASAFTNDLPSSIFARIVTVPTNVPLHWRLAAGAANGANVSWSETVAYNLTGMGVI